MPSIAPATESPDTTRQRKVDVLLDVLRNRRTTNAHFANRPLDESHVRTILEAASYAPSHFNSQPWRFVLVRSEARRKELGKIAGDSMKLVMQKGNFWKRYLKYFRFSKEETDKSGDGIHIDNMPLILRPFIQYLFSEKGGEVMNKLRVPYILAIDSKKLVASSPLILGVLLSKEEYKKGELSGMYSMLALGMAIENIWITANALGVGVQFISLPMEAGGEQWQKCVEMIAPPENFELIALFRLGYTDPGAKRPTIDWSSNQRKDISTYCFDETFGNGWVPKS
ncbi:MAG: nitroreductase family protein [Rhizobacter sp.]|nr:nitroreductase family protein [Chlorobiales bacterium]